MNSPQTAMIQGFQLTGADVQTFAKQYDLKTIGDAIEAMEFTVKEEVELLIKAMRSKDLKTSLKAQAQWRQFLKDNRMAASLLLTIVKKDDGTIERTELPPAIAHSLRLENLSAPSTTQTSAHEHYAPDRVPPTPDVAIRQLHQALGIRGEPEPLRVSDAGEVSAYDNQGGRGVQDGDDGVTPSAGTDPDRFCDNDAIDDDDDPLEAKPGHRGSDELPPSPQPL